MQAYKLETQPLTEQEKMQNEFLEILYHDAVNRNGFFVRSSFKPFPTEAWARDINNLCAYKTTTDTYVAINSFQGKSRLADKTHTINAIYFDLDWHDSEKQGETSKRIQNTLKALKLASNDGVIPYPTMITKSGRGLGIFYVLKRSIANTSNTKKQINYYEHICKVLANVLRDLLIKEEAAGTPVLDLDSKVVADKSRVCRLPGTLNTKTNTFCELFEVFRIDDEPVYYSLSELAEYIPVPETKPLDESKISEDGRVEDYIAFKTFPMLYRRLQKLRRAQEVFINKEGCRELLCFLYYNTAAQIYAPLEAREMLMSYSARFSEQIDDSELENIINSVATAKDREGNIKGYYKISDAKIVEILDFNEKVAKGQITQAQVDWIGFGRASKAIQREEKKQRNKEIREERNKKIAKYIIEHPSETYEEIAVLFELSLRTIKSIAKEVGISRNKAKKGNINTAFDALDYVDSSGFEELETRLDTPQKAKVQKNVLVSCCGGYLVSNNNILIYSADKLRKKMPREVNLSTKKRKVIGDSGPPD